LVINQPPVNTPLPAGISVLATEEGYESCGYGTASLKVALANIKEHYSSPNVRVAAITSRDSRDCTGVEFGEKFGFATIVCHDCFLGSVQAYQWMEAEITDALARIANDGALGCVIDAGAYSKIRMTRYRGLELYFTSELHLWDNCAIKDVPGLGGIDVSQLNYVRARETLKKMGITEDDMKKAIKGRGKGVELRAGASTPHQTQPDNISKLHLPIPVYQQLGDEDTNEECVKLSAACGLYHYNKEVANDLKKISTRQMDKRGNIHRQTLMTVKTLKSIQHEILIQF
jgi:hypothetical protein